MKAACFCFNACKYSNGQTKMPRKYKFKVTKSHKKSFVNMLQKFHTSMRRLKYSNFVQKHFGMAVNLACIYGYQ